MSNHSELLLSEKEPSKKEEPIVENYAHHILIYILTVMKLYIEDEKNLYLHHSQCQRCENYARLEQLCSKITVL
jgi:hypothetical protein